MSQDSFRMFKLAAQGFCCTQIMMLMALEDEGKDDNPDLIRAMQGLCGGMGRSGGTCGALTGGASIIGLAAGKGNAMEQVHPKLGRMIAELLDWFDETYASRDCEDIIQTKLGEGDAYPVKCGSIVSATYYKVREIMAKYIVKEEEEED
ncbi:DVU_1555 family C-GCAxxG-C-C protein [Desulfitobacterium sp. Sab5]|uniref:DVU_1555 family C-GCAxxG-C-C protein n=1 Tax=Desulfitobacterium nosdiversum TaxID=3375356 RepID=UPI003CE9BF28